MIEKQISNDCIAVIYETKANAWRQLHVLGPYNSPASCSPSHFRSIANKKKCFTWVKYEFKFINYQVLYILNFYKPEYFITWPLQNYMNNIQTLSYLNLRKPPTKWLSMHVSKIYKSLISWRNFNLALQIRYVQLKTCQYILTS